MAMSSDAPAAPSVDAVAAFLYREARLIDEHRYQEWLALWESSDTLYWVPCNEDDIDPRRHVSIIYDDHDRLEQRVERLMSGSVLAQQPLPKMRRIVSNIEPEQVAPDLISVRSNFILATARAGRQELWAGQAVHRLRLRDGLHRIVAKKVLLNNSDQEIPLLQFLI
jgi:3-phenylpropionate/cinnamic acid dioxygenase small subunit